MTWDIRPYEDRDWDTLLEFGYGFAATLDEAEIVLEDPTVFADALRAAIEDERVTCLVYTEDGQVKATIAWAVVPFMWNPKVSHASEVFFYNQDAGPRAAVRLLSCYEEVAKRQGVRLLGMTLLNTSDPRVARLYERSGARLSETTYIKEI